MLLAVPDRIDTDGTVCALQSRDCSDWTLGRGGFDTHHEYPISMGGAADQTTLLILCPEHHRRQHALLRRMVEDHHAGLETPWWGLLNGYTPTERHIAQASFNYWIAAGSPTISGWPCPAARVI